MPIYKRCSRCGKRLLSGTECVCKKQWQQERYKTYDKYARDKKSKQFYSSREWEKMREHVLELDGWLDVYIYMKEGKIIPADTVHHILPLREAPEHGLDPNNLISLSESTHSLIEKMYTKNKAETEAELMEILRKYRVMQRGGAV